MAENKTNVPQEIDLVELFQKIGTTFINWGKGILRAIFFLISFGFKNWSYIGGFAILGGLIGFGYGSISKPFYASEMIAQPNGITSMDMVSYINDLTPLCETKNYVAIKNALELRDTTIEKIKSIQAYHYVDVNLDGYGDYIDYKGEYNAKDTTTQIIRNRFVVGVEMYDNYSFNDVKRGIYKYIHKNEYLTRLNDIRKQELSDLIANTGYEIQKLDSLQNFEYFEESKITATRQQQSQLTFLTEKDKPLYYQNKLSLLNNKQKYEKELAMATDPITVIKDFTALSKEENPRGKMAILATFYSGIFAFFVLLLKNLAPKIIDKLD